MNEEFVLNEWARLLKCSPGELGEGEYFFSRFQTKQDLDHAWSLIPEHEQIRKRIATLHDAGQTAEELNGTVAMYVSPGEKNNAEAADLPALVGRHLAAMARIVQTDDEPDIAEFLSKSPSVSVGDSEDVAEPNQLAESLYEAASNFILDHMPAPLPYQILYNYAVSLTKYDPVAAYVLWPCLIDKDDLGDDPFSPGFDLWRLSASYWAPDNDLTKGRVLCRRERQ